MKSEPEISAFFADQTRLARIDELHRLLFDFLSQTEEGLKNKIKAMVDDLCLTRSQRWKRKDGRVRYELIGLVQVNPNTKWPHDLWVHFGWQRKNFLNNPWVGIYTQTSDQAVLQRIVAATKPSFNQPRAEMHLPIWENVPNWPELGDCICKGNSVARLINILPDDGARVINEIEKQLASILDQLDQ